MRFKRNKSKITSRRKNEEEDEAVNDVKVESQSEKR